MEEAVRVLAEYARLVNEALEKYIPRRIDEAWLNRVLGAPEYAYEVESLNKGVFEPFWDLADRGGKRWRPALMLMIYEALGGDPREIAPLAVIPEAIHNGTLAVDDVEDGSEFRRGKPCIHRIYGEDIAINMGNTMYYLPLLVLNEVAIPDEKKLKILEEYVRMMIRLSLGQAMDIAWHRGIVKEVNESQYLQMTLFKTGALAGFAAKMAAIMADAPEERARMIQRFAELIAVAFQIQDDILNLVGDEAKYGKEIGGDITEGKRTLMVIHALRNLPADEAERLRRILDMRTGDKRLIMEAIDLMKKAGSIDYARKVSEELAMEALEALRRGLPKSESRRKLEVLAEFLIRREF
ncbi:MAG: polyprenyl synthetase family protein [Thaumarchaeota archaeon]|jgi:geranylgeranyl pyrophosphate synthase|nr:polyprenyl synthetase family protein [Candidatus Wolframiiraptor allenii]